MALAFPGQTGRISEIVARDSFLDALGDAAICLKILEREPQTLDEALNMATRLEALGFGTLDGGYDETGRRKERYVRVAESKRDDQQERTQSLEASLLECQKELERVKFESGSWKSVWAADQQGRAQTWGQGQGAPASVGYYQLPA